MQHPRREGSGSLTPTTFLCHEIKRLVLPWSACSEATLVGCFYAEEYELCSGGSIWQRGRVRKPFLCQRSSRGITNQVAAVSTVCHNTQQDSWTCFPDRIVLPGRNTTAPQLPRSMQTPSITAFTVPRSQGRRLPYRRYRQAQMHAIFSTVDTTFQVHVNYGL